MNSPSISILNSQSSLPESNFHNNWFQIFEIPSFDSQIISVPICSLPQEIEELLNNFSDLFSSQHFLPPKSPKGFVFSHRIPLKKGTQHFNLCPFQYSIILKDMIDNLVNEMLSQGIIQHRA
ncbi:putative retroelement protein [Trifolium medium]|uniref:Putative retroelement protein n=1 Tax=Trifolium medium TaxID=97028 RepID=A0A392N0J8_9FABA|nr:putative retroelement protein [Trifolium medium]